MNSEKPLFSMTVNEFMRLMDSKKPSSQSAKTQNVRVNLETDSKDIIWVAKVTNLAHSTIRSKVCRGEIPFKKRGKPLIFSEEAIISWLENSRPKNEASFDFTPNHKKK
jgi:hypothetical protein